MCVTSAGMAAKLKIVTSKLALWHVRAQGTLAREHVSTQGMLAREHLSMECTLALGHVVTEGTLARDHVFSTQGRQFSRLSFDLKLE